MVKVGRVCGSGIRGKGMKMVSMWTRRWGVCADKKGSVEEVCEWSVKVESVARV